MIHFRVRYERLRGRYRRSHKRVVLLRALWASLVLPLVAIWVRLVTSMSIPMWLVLLCAGAVFAAVALLQARQMEIAEPSRALDRRYGLGELLVTAVEVDRRGPATSVEERLLDDAELRRSIVEHNRALARRHFGYATLRKVARAALDRARERAKEVRWPA